MTTPGGYSAGTIFLQVVPSFRNFHNALRREAKVANKAWADAQERARQEQADKDKRAAEKRGRESGGAYSKALNDAIGKAAKSLPEVKIDADTSEIDKAIALLKARLDALDGKDIKLGADSREAVREIKFLEQALARIAKESANPEIVVDSARAHAELRRFLKEFEDVKRARAEVEIDVDTNRAVRGIQALKRQIDRLDSNGNALRAFNGRVLAAATLLPLVVPAAVAAAGAIAAIGPAAIAGAAGLGILLAGFSGIGDAVKGLDDVRKNGAKEAATIARQQRNAARAVRDANQALKRAREDAAESAEDSARRVAEAQERQGDVAEQNARRMRDALEQQRRAEDDLADAQRDARRAQEDLVDARERAQDQLEDLALRARGGALAERQAVIDLFEAQVAYTAAMQDGGTTNLEREEKSIALEQARLRLEQQRLENARLADEQAEVKVGGVDGTEEVQRAAERVADANERVVDSQREVQDASNNIAEVQQDNARASAEAAESVQDALVAQARAARDSSLAITDAQERVADAQVNYQDALAQSGPSTERLADAMGKLGPAGQAFALVLYGEVLPALREMRSAIQEGLLPGVTDGMRTLLGTYGPQLTAFLGTMGQVFGDIFRDLAEMFTTPVWQEFFGMMAEYMPIFTRQWAELGGSVLTILAQLLTAFAPLSEDFMQFLVDGAGALSEFLASAEGQQFLSDFMETVREVGPEVMKFLWAFVKAMYNLGVALAPYADELLELLTGFLIFIAEMDPTVLGAIAVGLIGMTIAVQGIVGIASLITTIAIAVGILTGVGATMLLWVAGAVIGLGLLGVAFYLAWTHSETFRDIVSGTFRVLGAVIEWVWNNIIKPVFNGIWETIKFVGDVIYSVIDFIVAVFRKGWEQVTKAWDDFTQTGAGQAMIGFFDKYVKPAWEGFLDFVGWLWQGIKDTFKDGIFLVVETIINDGFIDTFNKLANAVGSKPIDRINLPASFGKQDHDPVRTGGLARSRTGLSAYATGGRVAGFSPTDTADNIPAWLTAGEYVLPVRAVRSLRARFGDDFLESLRRGMPGYATGGVVGFGRELQRRGFRVGEHPAFGGVAPVHKGRGHYEGRAIDVNYGPGGESDVEKRAIDAIVGLAKQYGLTTIWRTTGHFNHAHFEEGGKNIIGRIGDVLGSVVDAVVGRPVEYLMEKAMGALDKLPQNLLGDMLRGGARKVAEMLGNVLGFEVGSTGEFDTALPDFTGGSVQDMVRNAAAARGWGTGPQWNALASIVQRESGWNPNAQNPGSSAYGLFQFLNGTWAGTGFSKSSDPIVQAAAGMAYIAQRYGDPLKAKQFWDRNGYYADGGMVSEDGNSAPTLYDTGGWLQPGLTTVLNATGKPEPVFTSEQWDMIRRGGVGGDGGTTIEINTTTVSTASDIAHEVLFANRQIRRGGVHATRKAP